MIGASACMRTSEVVRERGSTPSAQVALRQPAVRLPRGVAPVGRAQEDRHQSVPPPPPQTRTHSRRGMFDPSVPFGGPAPPARARVSQPPAGRLRRAAAAARRRSTRAGQRLGLSGSTLQTGSGGLRGLDPTRVVGRRSAPTGAVPAAVDRRCRPTPRGPYPASAIMIGSQASAIMMDRGRGGWGVGVGVREYAALPRRRRRMRCRPAGGRGSGPR
jgi:hypothetical protein